MADDSIKSLPYTATSLSVLGRFIFMFLLYKNKSTNSLSLTFCLLSIVSAGMWMYYGFVVGDMPIVTRSCTEIGLLALSSGYIIRNKLRQQVLPI
jgi:uncharacterized protein with PQ loop repeat